MAKVTAEQCAEAIKKHKGFITHAARELGINRSYLHTLINRHPTIKEALTDAKEEMKDFAEGKIYQQIANDNTTMLIFYAKTQMKDRGYVERQEHTGADGEAIEITESPRAKLSSLLDGVSQRIDEADDIKQTD